MSDEYNYDIEQQGGAGGFEGNNNIDSGGLKKKIVHFNTINFYFIV